MATPPLLITSAAQRTQRRADLLKLLICGFCSLLIYGFGQRWFPVQTLGIRQLHTLGAETHGAVTYGIALALSGTALCVFYGLGYTAVRRLAHNGTDNRLAYWLVVVVPLCCALLLVWTYPLTSLDMYSYVFRGLMLGKFHANTFVQAPEAFKGQHPLFWYSIWREAPTAYGPLWETVGGFTAMVVDRFGPQPLAVAPGLTDIDRYASQLVALLVAFKLLGVIAIGGCAVVIARMARFADSSAPTTASDERLVGLYIWLWQPLVLWELVGAGHNDGWMLMGVLLAYAFLAQNAPRRALLALVFGALFKSPALLFGPTILAGALRTIIKPGEPATAQRWRQAAVMVAQSALLCVGLVALCYGPFWAGSGTFTNPMTRERLFSGSPITLLDLWLHYHMAWKPDDAWTTASRASTVIVALGALWAGWRMWQCPSQPVAAGFPLMVAPLVAASVFQPWYITWALALASLQPQRRMTVTALTLLSLGGWGLYLANDFLLPYLGWPFGGLRWQTLLVTSVYALPGFLLVLIAMHRIAQRNSGGMRVSRSG